MKSRERTWTERRPYPPESSDKYGAPTPSLGAHEEHTDLVEENHPAAVTRAEILRRQREDHPSAAPSRPLGYGGIGELDDFELRLAEWTFGVDPGSPITPMLARPAEAADAGKAPAAPPAALIAADADDDDLTRASHAPEGSSMRSTYPSLDRISIP